MPLFEFDDGRLIPAQFGRTVRDGLTDDILKSVREQVLEIVGRPLFPITWQDSAPVGSGMDGGAPRLTALDASGQVVSVEVVDRLDSTTMIDSLSRLADTASLGWNDLAAAYPGGIQGFRVGWAEFRDAMPPSPAPGPRLILVAGSIAEGVRPALDVLASSGVEVHEIAVRAMSNGRKFLDVQAVGPRLYGHNPNLLLGRTSQTLELTAFSSTEIEEPEGRHLPETAKFDEPTEEIGGAVEFVPGEPPEPEALEPQTLEPEAIDPGIGEPDITDPGYDLIEPGATPDEGLALEEDNADLDEAEEVDDERDSDLYDTDQDDVEGDETDRDESDVEDDEDDIDPDVPQLKEDSEGLHVIGQILGQETPIVWQRGDDERHEAVLTADGEIRTANWSTADPDEATAMVAGSSQYSGWEVWHLGDPMGPSLREALAELNREIRDEYENVGSPRRGRRSRRAK